MAAARPTLFRCPSTGLTIQTVFDAPDTPDDGTRQYRAVDCPACKRAHFINIVNGIWHFRNMTLNANDEAMEFFRRAADEGRPFDRGGGLL